ncbi:MAG: hypothetical protein EPO10_10710 [Reyranella sp.]|nr:MAG: hypothetical protein EPO10_10710 [Reyranella sp.]
MQVARREFFFDFYDPRLYAMVLGQAPILTAVFLGVTDLHLLAQLLSLGLFALPTALYHLALMRVKDDPVLLAAVLAAIGVVFMTTSFFIVGEYNTAYAIGIVVAVRLVTARELSVGDGAFLVAVGLLAIRTYEVMLYLGPLLALMIAWTVYRIRPRPLVATFLYLAAILPFLGGMWVAADSVIHPFSEDHLSRTAATVLDAWQNVQFDLAMGAALVISGWALLRPRDLAGRRPYVLAGIFLILLALSPLLVLTDSLVRPHAKSQYTARSLAGLVIATIVVLMWLYTSPLGARFASFVALRRTEISSRMLAFACLIVLAVLPSNIYLTLEWCRYLDTVRTIVRSNSGVIAYEATPLSRRPLETLVESWILPSQSLALRGKRGDGIIAPPRGFNNWQPFPPAEPYPLGHYMWRD